MNLFALIVVSIVLLIAVLLSAFKLLLPASSAAGTKFWLFYAGPENYLDRNGEVKFCGEMLWSCEPETRKGDRILLYRRSIDRISIESLVRGFSMSEEIAKSIMQRRIGKDIAALWEAVSDSQPQLNWGWPYGCYVKEIIRFNPPVRMEDLRSVPVLNRWESFRESFRAKGRSALEIPPFAWEILSAVIEKKCGARINQRS